MTPVSTNELDAEINGCVGKACSTVPMAATPTLYQRVRAILTYALFGMGDGSMYDPSRVERFYVPLDQKVAKVCLDYVGEMSLDRVPQPRRDRLAELAGVV